MDVRRSVRGKVGGGFKEAMEVTVPFHSSRNGNEFEISGGKNFDLEKAHRNLQIQLRAKKS